MVAPRWLAALKEKDRPTVRLWARRPDIAFATAGLAALAVATTLPGVLPAENEHPHVRTAGIGLALAFGIVGLATLIRAFILRVPLVDVEEAWNASYDRLRDATAILVEDVVGPEFNTGGNFGKYTELGDSWQANIENIPIPKLRKGEGPLSAWHSRLADNDSPAVRQFYTLARAVDGIAAGSRYRRLAVRTYDIYYRSRDTRPGFREWMEREEVASGAESLVVLLAYMEVARAHRVGVGKKATHLGFWELAREWHHGKTLGLPAKHGVG